MRRQIREQLPVFVAILFLLVLSLGIGGYILSNQRFYLPAWVPVLGTEFFMLNAEFQTAKSVTPGQGQTVTIAGVDVGEIARVDLVDGRARIELKIRACSSRRRVLSASATSPCLRRVMSTNVRITPPILSSTVR